jgi:peptidoglycan/LPS O-acetylase OafA/YrhL
MTAADHADQASHARLPYLPALDGLRAIALLAVLAFHAGFGWVSGGYLPLTSFFVLSGFLITALLLLERQRSGRVALGSFWARRARRLVPGALLGIGLVGVYARFGAEREIPGLAGDVLAALGWVANWRFIFTDRAYADLFGDPSPLQHYWSLAVEEQFYLVLPLLATAMLLVGRGRRWPFVAVVSALAVASVVVMRVVHDPGAPPLRAYFGTDTRAAELLIGVLLACALIGPQGLRQLTGLPRRLIDVGGALALVASVWTWLAVREYDDRLYQGGLVGIALLAALVVTAAAHPGTLVSRVLALRPLVWLGTISYGVYLFHWPLFLWIDEARTGLSGWPLFGLRMAVTVALAWVSWRFIEAPIRAGSLRPPAVQVAWANATVAVAACLVVVAAWLPSTDIDLLATDGRDETAAPPPPVALPAPATTAPAASEVEAAEAPPPEEHADPDPSAAPPGTQAPAPQPEPEPVYVVGPADEPPPAAPPPTAAPPSTATPDPGAALPSRPLRVMVLGDSVARNLANGLISWGERTGSVVVYDVSIQGCTVESGGMRYIETGEPWPIPESCDWWKRSFEPYARDFAPDVILVHTGTNEIYDRTHPSWDGRRAPGDPIFDRFLMDGYHRFVDVLARAGVPVVWAVPACNRWDPRNLDPPVATERLAVITGQMIPVLAAGTPIQTAPFHEQLCPGGQFSDTVAGVPDARPDGYHLTRVAADRLAETWLGPLLLRTAGR